MKRSIALRNYLLATGSLKAALAGGELRIFGGTVPADANAATTGATLLCTLLDAGSGINFDTAAAGGVLSKDPGETWTGINAAGGVATFFRHVLSADANDASTTALRIQGTIATAGADMVLGNTTLISGAVQSMPNYSVAAPE